MEYKFKLNSLYICEKDTKRACAQILDNWVYTDGNDIEVYSKVIQKETYYIISGL